MAIHVYIDLGYVERLFREIAEQVFADGSLEFYLPSVSDGLTGLDMTRKVFVYDCEPEAQRRNESSEEHEARVAKHDERLRAIELLADTYLRCGRLVEREKKRRGREQKRVDVHIAVDMLTHAFRGVMSEVFFVAGDDDFTPLLRAMMDTPCRVTLACARRTTHHDLMAAATNVVDLDPCRLGGWHVGNSNFAPRDGLRRHIAPGKPISNSVEYRYRDLLVYTGPANHLNYRAAWIGGRRFGYSAVSSETALRALCYTNGLKFDDVVKSPSSAL